MFFYTAPFIHTAGTEEALGFSGIVFVPDGVPLKFITRNDRFPKIVFICRPGGNSILYGLYSSPWERPRVMYGC